MHEIEDCSFNCITYGIKGLEPTQILKNISFILARATALPQSSLCDKLEQLTKDDSVGVGDGVAIYDWKSSKINQTTLALMRLENPVLFPKGDDRPVDVIVVLVSAEIAGPVHLRNLARITRLLRNNDFLTRVRDVTCQSGLEALLTPESQITRAA